MSMASQLSSLQFPNSQDRHLLLTPSNEHTQACVQTVLLGATHPVSRCWSGGGSPARPAPSSDRPAQGRNWPQTQGTPAAADPGGSESRAPAGMLATQLQRG